jgi:hypothetical protein
MKCKYLLLPKNTQVFIYAADIGQQFCQFVYANYQDKRLEREHLGLETCWRLVLVSSPKTEQPLRLVTQRLGLVPKRLVNIAAAVLREETKIKRMNGTYKKVTGKNTILQTDERNKCALENNKCNYKP